ncbi:major facilitator superfamily transporter [Periconia macrospinosa]|uniref:Major facilitator superfamily transporter n=1 Tax=Periconia macrospinosa TaxID=97972 RepID=A0A2V1DX91_9PLEO|nr:major facilitator superfamily transporter [Periconia macrospinosa]
MAVIPDSPTTLPPAAEAGVPTVEVSCLEKGTQEINAVPDELLVTFSNPPNTPPTNPLDWSPHRKTFTALLTSISGLITLMAGPMMAPALGAVARDLHISEAKANMSLSIYILAWAFGPMVLGPCSEVWGRRPICVIGGVWYVIWNTVAGLSNGGELLILSRLMAGLGASAEYAVSGPIVADIYSSDERGKSQIIRGALPLLGPAIGPLVAGVMVQHSSWRWMFHVLSIMNTIVVLLIIFFLPETHAPTLLKSKASRLRKATGKAYCTKHESNDVTLGKRLKIALVRPMKMLATHPTIQLIALVMGYQFGVLYIAHATFASVWTEHYNQSPTASGLHYFAIVIGCLAGLYGGGKAMDRIWAHLKEKNNGRTSPENRIPLLIPGMVMIPAGLIWYGWAAEKGVHWIVPDIGIAIFGGGHMVSNTAMGAYVVESFLDHTASAGAASQFPKNIFAFVFPIFAPSLFNTLGYGMGNTILAIISVVLSIPSICILRKYGQKLRDIGNKNM